MTSARALPALGLALTMAVALAIVLAQPLRSPWWTYADADASYAGTSLDYLLGADVKYLDHPGLPLEELGGLAYAVQYAGEAAAGNGTSRKTFVDRTFLDLDRARPVFRSLAVTFYLLGALLSFVLVARLLGHWTWGLAGGLLWAAAPGFIAMSIQFRPDVPLAVFCLVIAFLLGRAVQTRSPRYFLGASFVLGLAMMTKMHAAGLLPALALAAVWRHPPEGALRETAVRARRWARERRVWLAAGGLAWALAAFLANRPRVPFDLSRAEALATFAPIVAVASYLALARVARGRLRSVFDPFYGVLAAAIVAGLLVPVTLELDAGVRSMQYIAVGLTGRGINEPVEPFSASLDQLGQFPLRQALVVFIGAGIAALIGLWRREPLPVVLFVGAATLAVMAQARLAAVHYFAPAFVVSIPAFLWLLQRTRGTRASLLVWPIVAILVWPSLDHRDGPRLDAERWAAEVAPSVAAIESRLQPGEIGLVPSYWPVEDARFFGLVQLYASYTPTYPYRFLEEGSTVARELAAARGLRPRYYTGPLADTVTNEREVEIGVFGRFTARRVDPSLPVLELLPPK